IGLQTRVSDNEGNISNLTQIAQGLQTQVTDIEGNVSTLQQTAQGLQSSVTNLRDELEGLEIGGRNLAPVTGMQIVTHNLVDASNSGEQVDERTFKIYANPPANGISFLFGYA